jgi:hypothetical protein
MSVVGKRIQKQVRGSKSRQVFGQGFHAIREDQSFSVNAAPRGLPAQIAGNRLTPLLQPQHTIPGPAQNPHPAIEDLGQDLVAVVEATEHESHRRQSKLLA